MKKPIIALVLFAIIMACAAGGTLAYYTYDDTAHNVITSGAVSIKLVEYDEEGEFNDVSGAMPGGAYAKIVTVENDGPAPTWVRLKVDKAVALTEEGKKLGQEELDHIRLDIDRANWTEWEGYYYYKIPLEVGKTTEPLFKSVTFDTEMDNRYQGSTITVSVCAQAVQSDNNGETVLDARGWPNS